MAKYITIVFKPYKESIIGNEKTASIEPNLDIDVIIPMALALIRVGNSSTGYA